MTRAFAAVSGLPPPAAALLAASVLSAVGAVAVAVAGCATISEGEIERGTAAAPDLGGVEPALDRERGWREWRGTLRDGVIAGVEIPRELPAGEWPELWRLSVGSGVSGPVVADGKVFCHSREGLREIVRAIDAESGRPLWARENEIGDWDQPFEARAITDGPLATPAVRDGRLYTVGIYGLVQCLDAGTGDVLFRVSPESLTGNRTQYRYGHASSPLVRQGKLFVSFLGGDEHVFALDAATGELVWKAVPEVVSYTSPVYRRIGGADQIVVRSWERVLGLEPRTGEVLWSHDAPARHVTRDTTTPLVAGDVVFLTSNFHGTIAVLVTRGAGGWVAERLYRSGALAGGTSSPVYHDGHLYGLHKRGRFACMDAATGERAWVARAFDAHLSLIASGNRCLALDEDGWLALLELSPEEYRALARRRIGHYTWAHPALGENGRLYFRDGDELAALGLR